MRAIIRTTATPPTTAPATIPPIGVDEPFDGEVVGGGLEVVVPEGLNDVIVG